MQADGQNKQVLVVVKPCEKTALKSERDLRKNKIGVPWSSQ